MKRQVIQVVVTSFAAATLSLLYFVYPAKTAGFYPRCIFNQITGLYCPGCGSQRAASALLHGHFLQAVDYNVLFVASIPFILYSAFVFIWNTFSRKVLRQRLFYSPVFTSVVLAAVILFWILRNIPASPYNWLAP